MVINSFLGSNTRFSSSPFTTRMSDSLFTMGVSVDFRERSYWQSPIASTHSSNTSLRIFFRNSFSAASISGLMTFILTRKS